MPVFTTAYDGKHGSMKRLSILSKATRFGMASVATAQPCLRAPHGRRNSARSHSQANENQVLSRRTFFTTALAFWALPLAANAAVEEKGVVYFGNGCFWGRQKSFIDTELDELGRWQGNLTSVVGYAGGKKGAEPGSVCYYTGPQRTHYEDLGHAEVVKVDANNDEELRKLARAYFGQFVEVPGKGMIRSDPQDKGPGYRNVIGLPGGAEGRMFQVIKEENVNNMDLRRGAGNEFTALGAPTEGDMANTVWVLDSNVLPFYQAEVYHQFHDGVGAPFPKWYKDLKRRFREQGRLSANTGCPDIPL